VTESVRVVMLDGQDRPLAADAEFVAFLRPGDRHLPGGVERLAAALRDRPAAGLAYGGYVRTLPGGRSEEVSAPEQADLDASTVILRCPIQPAAVLARAAPLRELAPGLLAAPGGDLVALAELVATGQPVRIEEMVANVAVDPVRDGLDPAARVEQLLTIATSAGARRAGVASAVRRELLTRAYLDVDAERGWQPRAVVRALHDASEPDERAAIAEDVQWALERQAEVLAAEHSGWPRGEIAEADRIDAGKDLELTHRDATIQQLQVAVEARDTQLTGAAARLKRLQNRIGMLERAIAERDRRIAAGSTAGEAPAPVPGVRAGRRRLVPWRVRHWVWQTFPGLMRRVRGIGPGPRARAPRPPEEREE
jgi:hypothetical protein